MTACDYFEDLDIGDLRMPLRERILAGELPEKFVRTFVRWIEVEGTLVEGTPDEDRYAFFLGMLNAA
jgi:hypothetical protein